MDATSMQIQQTTTATAAAAAIAPATAVSSMHHLCHISIYIFLDMYITIRPPTRAYVSSGTLRIALQ
jgi:hypothetical protein